MRTKDMLRLGGPILLAFSLTACGGGNNNNAGAPPPAVPPVVVAPPPATFQSMFGAAFAAVFNASTTSEPIDPTDASVPPLAPASEPLDN